MPERTSKRARRLAQDDRNGGTRPATGPDTARDEHWGVSFDVDVPRNARLLLNTRNGGISIADFHGAATFHAANGGISLTDVSGDIRGETTNGGLTIRLSGDGWEGAGLDVRTRNGGVRMSVPERYSAELETGTVNGRVRNEAFSTRRMRSAGASAQAITGAADRFRGRLAPRMLVISQEIMGAKPMGRIDRHISDFDVMEHVISGWYPGHHDSTQPRAHAPDSAPKRQDRQGSSHPKRPPRHK